MSLMQEATEIVWDEPPERTVFNQDLTSTIATLRANPGKWALISEDVAANTVMRWRQKYPDIEFTSRRRENEEYTRSRPRVRVWARGK